MPDNNGLTLIVPTSVAATGSGSSATVSATGKVTFSTAETVSVNWCFTSTYDNYLLVLRYTLSVTGNDTLIRVRASGTDASGTNYTSQDILANNTSVTGSRRTSATSYFIGGGSQTRHTGSHIYFYGPNLEQPTAFRLVTVNPQGGDLPCIYDTAGTHSLSTAYDGFTLTRSSGTLAGTMCVYGLSQ